MSRIAPSAVRREAIALLDAVLTQQRTLDEAAASLPLAGDSADARFAMLLALAVLRHLGQLDALIARYLDKPLPVKRTRVTQALRIGLAQLLLLDTPAHAAVNETVEAIKGGKDAGLAGLLNAVLQRAAREKPALPEALHNIPGHFRARWEQRYGAAIAAAVAEAAAQRPPLDLNLPQPATMPSGARLDGQIWRLPPEHESVAALPGFAEGAFFVQDIAASYPVRLLGDVRGRRVLDLAAAPGGKTMQLARDGALVTALDRGPGRMRLLAGNLARMKLSAECITADILEWQPATPYDAILLDAPCSATGTWRRHPEVLALTGERDIAELAALQRKMLSRAWDWLKSGGRMVYCVCSLEPEEGEAQAQWFLDTHKDARLVPAQGLPAECIADGMLRTRLDMRAGDGGMDGFFAACFTKC
ncbi:MAG: transcription antitermination factor NusB [Alphaproteobacteria bacterium]